MKDEHLTIIIDERMDRLDKFVFRAVYCAVEIPDDITIETVRNEVISILGSDETFKKLDKLHFTSMNHNQRKLVVDLISKMNITAKVYIHYSFRKNDKISKINGLVSAVRATQYKHRNKRLTIFVEDADEYKKVIKNENLLTDHFLTLLPDVICSIFTKKLNSINDVNEENNKFYKLIRHQIRLHTYYFEKKVYEDTKDNRI